MGAPRLVPLRRRGTEEQRYARLQKWLYRRDRKNTPHLGICYGALWARRWARTRTRISDFVDIKIECVDVTTPRDHFPLGDILLVGDKVPYTDHGIAVLKNALVAALESSGHSGVVVR